jgi:hypothetical protein
VASGVLARDVAPRLGGHAGDLAVTLTILATCAFLWSAERKR